MKYYIHKVGADVEVFLKDQLGNPVPVCGLLGGTKENPVPIEFFDLAPGSAYQEDNVMAEFNVVPSVDSYSFSYATNKVVKRLITIFAEMGLLIDISASKEFKPEQLKSKQAQHVGCSVDYNAWSIKENPQVKPELLGNVRTAGGHVHVSFDLLPEGLANDDYEIFRGEDAAIHQARMVRMLDLTLGVPSVLIDKDTRRKQFYGKAGAYRPKPYGIEYRGLSNFWIRDLATMEWVYNQVIHACNLIKIYSEHGGCLPESECRKVISCINNNDQGTARALKATFGLHLP